MRDPKTPPVIIVIFCCSILYWAYLMLTTQMDIVFDAIGYEDLGRYIYREGFFPAYFLDSPRREPVYPLLIAFSMHIGSWTGLAYTQIMALIGVAVLMCTQMCLYLILRSLNIRLWICSLTLAYFAVSPAMNNAAFSLYSEIAAILFILPMVLISFHLEKSISMRQTRKALLHAGILGTLSLYITMVKAPFEVIAPIYLLAFFAVVLSQAKKNARWLTVISLGVSFACFMLPLHAYKKTNQVYNGNYVLTDRASWALYGNTMRRSQPMTAKKYLTALSYAPGEGMCAAFFTPDQCFFWSFQRSDDYGMTQWQALRGQNLAPRQIDKALFDSSRELLVQHFVQCSLLTLIESIKMYFWESTRIGFVQYPPWLEAIYANTLFKNGLRLLIGALSMSSMFYIWTQILRRKASLVTLSVGVLAFLYIGAYSFFFILTRYALPIAPLFLISIAVTVNLMYNNRHGQPE